MTESYATSLLRKQLRGEHARAVKARYSQQWHAWQQGSYNCNLHCTVAVAELTKNPVDGFSAGLVDDSNIFEWAVTIIGPPDTL